MSRLCEIVGMQHITKYKLCGLHVMRHTDLDSTSPGTHSVDCTSQGTQFVDCTSLGTHSVD